jgi:hypothetical protein
VVNKACTYIILINVDGFHSTGSPVMSVSWLHKHLGLLNNHIELDPAECACQFCITMGGFTPRSITEAHLSHRLPTSEEIESLRESYCLASGSMGHCNHQCVSHNQSECPLDLTMVRTISWPHHRVLTEAMHKPKPPLAMRVGLSGSWRLRTLKVPSIAVRWAAKVWMMKGL